MTVLLCISASAEEADRLQREGPRRDFVELAKATGGEIMFRSGAPRRGLVGRLAGPHVRQAWRAAARSRNGDAIFADGEHNGLPLALFLALRRRRVQLTMLGHFVDRPWKMFLFWALSRACQRSRVVVHSFVQRDILVSLVGQRWDVITLPYQVDTEFWTPTAEHSEKSQRLVLAVGNENRDYQTLVEAARDVPARVLISAVSHWARDDDSASSLPLNVEYSQVRRSFSSLRQAYDEASVVVVPLRNSRNAAGVTTILEAMSMARPVITTANEGQRECVQGALVDPDGRLDGGTTDRGPNCFGVTVSEGATGWYTHVEDVPSLRAAILLALENGVESAEMGRRGRQAAQANFTIERHVTLLAETIIGGSATGTVPALQATPAQP